YEQVRAPSDQPTQTADQRRKGKVGPDHAATHAGTGTTRDDARPDDHRDDGTEDEHDERIAQQAISDASTPWKLAVFGNRQSANVAGTATVEIAGRPMMDRVVVSPTNER